MTVILDILIEAEAWSALPDIHGLAQRAIDAALAASGRALPAASEASLLFSTDARIAALNGAFRGLEAPTNVLSFPAAAGSGLLLGDIALAFTTTEREAREEDKTLADHTAHLLIHGFLHLLGYDHDTDADAEIMEDVERRALARLGIADPYRAGELERHVSP